MSNTLAQNTAVMGYSLAFNVTKAYASNCTPGSVLIATLTADTNVYVGTLGVSDATNGTWAADKTAAGATYGGAGIFSVQNSSSSALSVVGTTSTLASGYMKLYEFTGMPGSSIVDVTGSYVANGAGPSITLNTTGDNDTIILAAAVYSAMSAADTGFTRDFGPSASTTGILHGTERLTDAGTHGTVVLTMGGQIDNCIVAVAYKTAGAAPPSSVPKLPMMGVG